MPKVMTRLLPPSLVFHFHPDRVDLANVSADRGMA
jgi:hypothetical protein